MTWHIWMAFWIGLMAGGFLGIVLMSLMAMSSKQDDWKDSQ